MADALSKNTATKSHWLYNTANEIIEQAGRDPKKIAQKFGIEILPVSDFESLMGCCVKTGEQSYIVINDNLDEDVKRFIILHEFAHLYLHPNEMRFFKDRSNFCSPCSDIIIQEHEANVLATHIYISDEEFLENVYREDSNFILPFNIAETKTNELKKLGIIN